MVPRGRKLPRVRCALLILLLLVNGPALGQDATLADTRWELVTIQSMDDSSLTPDNPANYTLAFTADGGVTIRSDCNRLSGSWRSEGRGQLTFGVLDGTPARCPPGSLDEAYRAQFPWVRSYVFRDGHLFLATMADGSIIEFRPVTAPPAPAG